MKKLKELVRKYTPKFIFSLYYFLWSALAATIFRFPAKELLVIGVTGTNGKTTTVNVIAHVLQSNGIRTGMLSTANFKIGNKEWVNKSKNTMLGRLSLQKMLRRMVKDGCKVAVVEVSSEGIASHRTYGIDFDILVFTNLTPEHIEAHGSFENYKKAKQRIFAKLAKSKRKKLIGFDANQLRKTIIANIDDKHAEDFLRFDAEQKIGFGIEKDSSLFAQNIIKADIPTQSKEGIRFNLNYGEDRLKIESKILGAINTYNLLAGASVAMIFGISAEKLKASLESFSGVAGRLDRIKSSKGYDVIIDYALTPDSLQELYKIIREIYTGKIIAVFGSCGGGRDKKKRPLMGQIVSGYADYSILTNEDPYFEDPYEIVHDIEQGFKNNDKIEKMDYEIILNREQAIEKALLMVQKEGDVLVITGKGSETGMNIAGKIQPFNDKEIVMKYIK
ncbi:MAG TPA: UDP-N-acetylmuramoyl-L-alanyl-D-glutamate--2,6-diaminopimelate ligase [Patescibacteria group bacterium]|nr:UDP-N-acetylmuramoyl-L-alanyl-D-glutamate--2,6-diaminopimelate ligase [Patescibacteria group bacterium]